MILSQFWIRQTCHTRNPKSGSWLAISGGWRGEGGSKTHTTNRIFFLCTWQAEGPREKKRGEDGLGLLVREGEMRVNKRTIGGNADRGKREGKSLHLLGSSVCCCKGHYFHRGKGATGLIIRASACMLYLVCYLFGSRNSALPSFRYITYIHTHRRSMGEYIDIPYLYIHSYV